MLMFGKYQFRHRWSLTVSLMILLPLGLILGNWQLDRAEQKRQLLARYQQNESLAPVKLDFQSLSGDIAEFRYREVVATGSYDLDRQILLDNQKYRGVPGYQVYTPMQITGTDQVVLVNRGWVRQGDDRRFLPDLQGPQQALQIKGWAGDPPSVGIKLGIPGEPGDVWPKRLLYIDYDWIAAQTGYKLLPWVVYLPAGQLDGLIQTEPVNAVRSGMTPDKHMSYAVQWFFLTALVVVMYVLLSFKKIVVRSNSGVENSE